MNRNKRQKGFSLIELLIVVAIILVISAIAIPNLLRAKQSGNKAAAVADLHTLYNANLLFYNNCGSSYAPDLTAMGPITPSTAPGCTDTAKADLLDGVMAVDPAVKSGYQFTYVFTDANDYTVSAIPWSNGAADTSNLTNYFMNQSGVIRTTTDGRPASAASAPIS